MYKSLKKTKSCLSFKYFIILAGILVLSGCVTPRLNDIDKTNIPVEELVPNDSFVIESGDELKIRFFYNQELNEDNLLVLPDGTISLQLIGDIVAKGKSIPQLRYILVERYKQHISYPEITLQINNLKTRNIYIGGEVRNPGRYQFDPGLNLLQSIIMSGGFKPTAQPSNILILRKKTGKSTSVLQYYIYDMNKNFTSIENYDGFTLKESDIVFVSTSPIGNVKRFVDLYVSSIFPAWFNVFVSYEVDKNDN